MAIIVRDAQFCGGEGCTLLLSGVPWLYCNMNTKTKNDPFRLVLFLSKMKYKQ